MHKAIWGRCALQHTSRLSTILCVVLRQWLSTGDTSAHQCPGCAAWLVLLPHCKDIICHVMHEADAGTWFKDQMQFNRVIDPIKVLHEPPNCTADPSLYWTKRLSVDYFQIIKLFCCKSDEIANNDLANIIDRMLWQTKVSMYCVAKVSTERSMLTW